MLNQNNKEQRLYIPEKVDNYFDNEFDYTTISNTTELKDLAVSIFVGLLNAQNVPISSGGWW